MSRLLKSAVKFDKTPCQDAYTGSFSFNGQLKAWPETIRDSEVAQRRVLSCAPGIVIPARRAINAMGEVYVLGHAHQDTFKGQPIRVGYTASLVDGLATVSSLGNTCLGITDMSAFAGKAWVKNSAYTQQDSHLNPTHQVFFSTSEVIPLESVITLNGIMLLARAKFEAPSGLQIVSADEVQSPNVETGTFEVASFDPVTNTRTSGSITVKVLRLRWQSLFSYGQNSSPSFQAGDMVVVVPKVTVTPVVNSTFVLSDGRWTILSIVGHSDSWVCRVQRAG